MLIDIANATKKWKNDHLTQKDTVYQIRIEPFTKNLDYP